ncbi:hypothetical protein [Lichenifustis flavocetrariae]|uniref:Uncharacterized protein n=1 Tax=Lichenifustis flavocetrariae TaxID=2949735 RepID=A0AA41Z183_9HYPH|nr:hypothetical protein [Lichenifustis flavocetrariae]MCW6512351.1 hypothetical protein [Lichenifustis flavocetrariae]
MQRKDMDEDEFLDLRRLMTETVTSPGEIATVAGNHPAYRPLILIQAGPLFAVMANDVGLIVGKDEEVEDEVDSL